MNWSDPRQYATALKDEENLVFLYSGTDAGKKSYLAWGLENKIDDIKNFIPEIGKKYFGYLGYGLRCNLEILPRDANSIISLPDFLMMQFKNLLVFDHVTKTISGNINLTPTTIKPYNHITTQPLNSNMSDVEYKNNVSKIVEKIHAGELYQANITRKFFGEFSSAPDTLAMFCKLTEISPAPYSAYIKFGEYSVISASPESFLTIENGIATTSPIKGTLRAESPAAMLANSEKDRAENLMIVDLMRNDLSKTCVGVQVPKLFEVTSYAKYHHMSSTITAKTNAPPLEVLLGCFPAGSMTGAPKIAAMKLCSHLEKIERGIYSGAIGYFDSADKCNFSVVIRTLIIHKNKFEFQVGGGIVADSTPDKELEEIYVKARPLLELLEFGN